MKISVIGDGGWGTAIALLLHGYGHKVTVWVPFADYLDEIKSCGQNSRYLPGVKIPDSLEWTNDETVAAAADCVVLAVPSRFYASVCSRFAGKIPTTTPVVSLTKGLCESTHQRMSEIAAATLNNNNIVVLSGPSHAEEVARGIPTAVVAATHNHSLAVQIQELFSGPRFRVYTSPDPLGVELGGAIKNVIAIAVGASDGLGFGDNTRAAIITRGLAEMTRLGVALGALPETFAGLSGTGDLIVTCTSRHSRNRSVGERLGKGESIQQILDSMKMVAEGVWNAKAVRSIATAHNVDVPISAEVCRLCYENASAADSVTNLMSRDMKPESAT